MDRVKIGKMDKEGAKMFRYDHCVLSLKFRAYEALGLSRPTIMKLVTCCPTLLIGGVDKHFQLVLARKSSFKSLRAGLAKSLLDTSRRSGAEL